MQDTKAKLRAEQNERAAARVAKLRKLSGANAGRTPTKSKMDEESDSDSPNLDQKVYKRPRTIDAQKDGFYPTEEMKSEVVNETTDLPKWDKRMQFKVDEGTSFRNAILRSRSKAQAPTSVKMGPTFNAVDDRSEKYVDRYGSDGIRSDGNEMETAVTWKRTMRLQLEKTAQILVKVIMLTIVIAAAYHFILNNYLISSHAVSYCSPSDGNMSDCEPCPAQGLCEDGLLVGCIEGYSLPASWNIFNKRKNVYCEATLSSKVFGIVKRYFPYGTTLLLTIGMWWWKRRTAIKASAQAHNWIRETWKILNSIEEPMPLVRIHLYILFSCKVYVIFWL